jgi:hypothetical protein
MSNRKEVIMKEKHTSVPWKIEKSIYGKFIYSMLTPICQINNGGNEADAQLIIAAPELLKACKDTLDIILAYQHIPAQKKACMMLQDVIEKAEGK